METPPELPLPARQEFSRDRRGRGAGVMEGALIIFLFVGIIGAIEVYRRDRAEKFREAMRSVASVADEEVAGMVKSLEKGEDQLSDSALARLRDQIDQVSTQLSGDDAAITRGLANYIERVRKNASDYQKVADRLAEKKIFEFGIRDRETLADYRQVLLDIALASDQFARDLRSRENELLAELQAARVSPGKMQAAIRSYRSKQGELTPLIERAYESDRKLCESGLAILGLLERNWGKWRAGESPGQLYFEDQVVLAAFSKLMEKTETVAAEQRAARKDVVNFLREHR